MAPRKDAAGPPPSASQSQQDASSDGIEDFELPRMLVTQLAKSALPQDIKLDADTITVLVKGSTVFINHLSLIDLSQIASAAQEIAASRAHKTISGADVLKALENLEFGELVTAFQGEVEAFRQGNKMDKTKIKSPVDTKGKAKEKDSSTKSDAAQPDSAGTISDIVSAERHSPDHVPNGVSIVDVEMRDVSERGIGHDEIEPAVPIE